MFKFRFFFLNKHLMDGTYADQANFLFFDEKYNNINK